ncbi:MAG: SurA N-terminal domain-containing protein [Kiritimatiellales bacterium]|nr:SurA N-terminal domain-containing protein [Kiritimatiellales bacterium]
MAMLISKFHRIIQSKVVWAAFAVLISVAFVGVYTPGAKSRSQARQEQKSGQLAGRLYGEDVSRMEFGRAYQNIHVMYTMMFGRAINITDEIDKVFRTAAWQRIATLKKAQQLGMTVTPDQIVSMIQRQPIFQNQQTGQFDKNAYNAFAGNFLPRVGMGPKDLENLFAEQVLIEKVSQIPAQGAVVSEDEIKKAFHLYTDMLTVEYAAIPRSLSTAPAVTEADANAYFTHNTEQFRMPEKAIVDYVKFAVADYMAGAEPTDEMIAGYYENNKQRYLKDPAADMAAGSAPEYKPLEEVKGSIAADLKQALARKAAADQADALVSSLADESMTFKSAAEKAGLTIVDNTPAFTLTDPVKGVDPTAPFQRAAFALEKDETHYYSDPVVGRDFVYVIALTKKLPSFLPSFDVVREAATESAKIAAAEKAYVEKAEQIHAEIKAALKAGTAFADAAAKYKLGLKKTEPFNVASELTDDFGKQIKSAAIQLDQGKLTDLISTTDEYLVAYVAEKVPGDENTALPGMRAELANNISNEKASRLVASWREALLDEAKFEDLTLHADDNDKS